MPDITVGQLVIWIIIGALVGSFVGRLVKDRRQGYGFVRNLALGMVGAVLGGFIFDALDIDLGLGDLVITFEDLVAAFVGSLIVWAVLWFLRRR